MVVVLVVVLVLLVVLVVLVVGTAGRGAAAGAVPACRGAPPAAARVADPGHDAYAGDEHPELRDRPGRSLRRASSLSLPAAPLPAAPLLLATWASLVGFSIRPTVHG